MNVMISEIALLNFYELNNLIFHNDNLQPTIFSYLKLKNIFKFKKYFLFNLFNNF
jgi:hypothetical protein